MSSRCDRCGEIVTDLDTGFSPGVHGMKHDCGGTWRVVDEAEPGRAPARASGHYLGDGVYATHDHYSIWLRTDRDGITHSIALDPSTIDALLEYRREIWGKS